MGGRKGGEMLSGGGVKEQLVAKIACAQEVRDQGMQTSCQGLLVIGKWQRGDTQRLGDVCLRWSPWPKPPIHNVPFPFLHAHR